MNRKPRPVDWPARLAWLLLLWIAGVTVVGSAAWLLRAVMDMVGLSKP
jgi:hypothetical protein